MDWDRSKLEHYISRIPDLYRDVVVEQIFSAKFLRDALDSEGGKALLNDAVKILSDRVQELIALCANFDEHPEKVRQAAIEVRATQELLKRWAITLTVDAEHRQKAEERKR